MTDNQNPSLLGAYGNREIKTPRIDQLAREGMLFSNAFAASGVCSPTRAALLTGLMPSQTGVHVALPTNVSIAGWSAIEEFRNLPQTLSSAGYKTALVGKYHLGEYDQAQLDFDYWVTFPGGHTTTFWNETVIDNGETYAWERYLTDLWTQKAIEFVNQQSSDQPFFLMLTYNSPYMLPPTVLMEPKGKFADDYKNHVPAMPQAPVHPYLEAWAKGRGPTGEMIKEGTTAWSAIRSLNNPIAMINTAAETTLVDDGIGRLLDAVTSLGFDENTLVIFTSDQGSSYGQHGLWGNTSWSFPFTAYDVNMQVPLIVRYPGHVEAGSTSGRFINQVDLFPTLLAYTDIPDKNIANSSGKSFAPILAGSEIAWEDVAFFEFVTVRVIQTPEWQYTKHFEEGVTNELYNLAQDPDELNNVIADPDNAGVVQQLDDRLTEYFSAWSTPKYDLWNGGTAKAILLDKHSGADHIFSDRFPGWEQPTVEKAVPFHAGRVD